MTDRELMQAVLEAMESLHRTGDTQVFDIYAAPVLIPALRERLAQPEQEPNTIANSEAIPEQISEPVAWTGVDFAIDCTPPRREWVGLTDVEIDQTVDEEDWYNDPNEFARAIEAKLKEKNSAQ